MLGGDEMNGKGGNDDLDGHAGADTIHGGGGRDLLKGGDDKAADQLFGDNGNDTIQVGTADQAFGGDGNDLFLLGTNRQFGAIDGGDQPIDNLRSSRGDILQFDGKLDLTAPGVSERIHDIETLSMKDGQGNDKLTAQCARCAEPQRRRFQSVLREGRHIRRRHRRADRRRRRRQAEAGGRRLARDRSQQLRRRATTCSRTRAPGGGNAYVLVQEDIYGRGELNCERRGRAQISSAPSCCSSQRLRSRPPP